MVTGSSVEMAPAPALGGGNFEDFERDLEAMLREAHAGAGRAAAHHDLVHELSPYRSGSAPPTVEGARAAVGRLFGPAGGHNEDGLSEEEMRSHPAYLSYYYSNEHLNPRLPPPMVSKEDWRAARRFQAFRGKTESWEEDGTGGSSLFSLQPGRPVCKGNMEFNGSSGVGQLQSPEWSADGLIGLADVEMASRRKSFAEAIQEEFGGSNSIPEHLSQPASRNAYDKIFEPTRLGSSMSRPIASGLNSPARSATPDCQSIGRSLSPCLPPVGGRVSDFDKKIIVGSNGLNGIPSRRTDTADMTAALSGLSLSKNRTVTREDHVPGQFHQDSVERHGVSNISTNSVSFNDFSRQTDVDLSKLTSNGQLNFQKQSSSSNLYKKMSSVGSNKPSGSSHYHNAYSVTQGIPVLNNQLDAGPVLTPSGQGLYLNGNGNQVGSGFQVPIGDPLYVQYRNGALDSAALAATKLNPSLGRTYSGNSSLDFSAYHKAYIEALVARQNLQQDMPFISKAAALNHGFYGSPGFGLGKAHMSNPISNSVLSALSPGNQLQLNERVSRFPSMERYSVGGSTRAWNLENGVLEEGFGQSLLDEFKNNKTGSYELTDIVDHVVEFSADQFGSRFIQQKLETASVEEKNKIFPEILLHARALMTDVFGNYVIQKFFEHGTEIQRKQLASQLIGHVLPLSLQMYGCRVIQKALEVVDVDYQTQMVLELDGAIMKCVRDQNGNHVIQKCIECVPQEKIQFIISSFYGQVVALSTHPYGCRVIQRVLEHCDDPRTQSTMMDEIMQSVCTLAQDQYGNYVVQHVLQHGKPEERSAIISKLAGKIVEMSQQKFASNVVEKCLTYGMPDERQILINEILGSTDENEPLQAMMKDQFGNYVVQKVLETCDDRNRELILSRVKVYLNALKKYTYGKHIVARVEKLIAAGERRSGSPFQLS